MWGIGILWSVLKFIFDVALSWDAQAWSNFSTIILGLASLGTSLMIFRITRKDTKEQSDDDRRLQMTTSVVFNYHVPQLYDEFKKLEEILSRLQCQGQDRGEIEQGVQSRMNSLNNIVIVFDAIDSGLHDSLIRVSDRCRDHLVEAIGWDELDFSDSNTFIRYISKNVSIAKKQMVKIILDFK